MFSIIFICPYFGKLPQEHFQLWLESCRRNESINWLIITDDMTEFDYPSNVTVLYKSFEQLKDEFSLKLIGEISLDYPYKLCDFKPMYGFLFEELIENYDFWGHCDLSDMIFGDIRAFISDDILKKNDKILFLGHMTLYKNNQTIRNVFKENTPNSKSYNTVICSDKIMGFDEGYEMSINNKFEDLGYSVAKLNSIYLDIAPTEYLFSEVEFIDNFHIKIHKNSNLIVEWNDGKLYKCVLKDGKIIKNELCYVHFQKRKMLNEVTSGKTKFLLVPNKFVNYDKISSVEFQRYNKKTIIYKTGLKIKVNNLKYRIRKKLGIEND